MIHMEYYLVVSTIMMFAGIYGFFTRRNLLDADFGRVDSQLGRYQLRCIQPFPVSGAVGRLLLCPICHRGQCGGDGCGDCHHHQYLSEYTQYSGEEHE